jgi:transcriptional regulator with XRE-family HTH domain
MFKQLLKRAGINKAELARRLKIQPATISNWKGDPPGYAEAYLELLIDCNYYREKSER